MSNAYWDLIDRRGRPYVSRELAEWQALEYPRESAGWLLRARDGPSRAGKKLAGRVRASSPASTTRTEGPA